MRFTDGATMRDIDRRAIEEFGIPSIVLMENAAVKTIVAAERVFGRFEGRRILVIAGPGNNGGDGIAIARHLANAGCAAAVALLADPAALPPDAAANLEIATRMGIPVERIADEAGLALLETGARAAEFIIDALFGTGLSRPLEGLAARAVECANASRGKRIAIDLPSGICSDTGRVLGAAVRADATVALGLPKAGHFLHPGAAHVGRLFVADIGIPRDLLERESPPRDLVDTPLARTLLPVRPADGHKGTFGRVLVIAGSKPYAGAALMTAAGALRIGAGLVGLASTREVLDLATVRHPELLRLELPDDGKGGISGGALVGTLVDGVGPRRPEGEVLAIGPGIGRDEALVAAAGRLFSHARRAVLDADGLAALAGAGAVENGRDKLITPHAGEAARLLGMPRDAVNADRIAAARALADRHGVNVLLKGAGSVLALPGGGVRINTSGSNALAKGGTGDVLAGLAAGLMAQGLSAPDAAALAAFLHGAAGERAAKEQSNYAVLATEIADGVGRVVAELEKGVA